MALTTFAVLSYRLIFYSTRELSITAMLFCCACSLCVAELVAAAVGNASGMLLSGILPSGILPSDILTVLGSNIASGVKLACNHSILSQQARLACCTYTTWLAPKNYSENCYDSAAI